jgi:ATPase subunit of ABC transporter with duplicated ATPase domains
MFLQRIATRIVEIDRCRLFDQVCDYETFLARRAAAREVEETRNALFDKKLKNSGSGTVSGHGVRVMKAASGNYKNYG